MFGKKKKVSGKQFIGAGINLITPKIQRYLEDTGGQRTVSYDMSKKDDALSSYKAAGIKKVKILTSGCCSVCGQLEGKVYDIQDFSKQILPNKKCVSDVCICTFIAVFD